VDEQSTAAAAALGGAITPSSDDLRVAPGAEIPGDAAEGDRTRSPTTGWSPWTAFVALLGGLVLAAIAGLTVDLPALALGAHVTSSHTPPGLAIADTFVQDLAFVGAAVYCAHIGGRMVRAWQIGLRPPGVGWWSATGMILLLLILFSVISVGWSEAFNPSKEKLLQQLGSNEGTMLLLLSAALTCVVAPMCEEILFRGYIFTALRNWRGTATAAVITGLLFGGVHAGSAPALDLVPLAGLGFGLCLLYRHTGSLYPCMVAHSLNNSIAFSILEGWSWQMPVLIVGALLGIGAVVRGLGGLGLSPSSALLARSGA
jgi:membrane protease YdiL (CAAX protease family)